MSSRSTRSARPTRSTRRTTREVPARGRQAPARRNPLLIWGPIAGVVLLALLGAWWFFGRGSGADLTGVQTFPDLARDHVEAAQTYAQTPPVGGPHNPRWLNCGIYDEPVPNEYAVHSLEHGTVWFTYRPDLPAADVETLRNLVRGHSHTLLSPYPDLPSPVVASAWGLQLKVDSVNDPRLAAFLDEYEKGSQTPEPGATCRGGVGVPVDR